MLLGGIAVGLIAGLLAGGRLGHLADLRLRWAALLFVAVILRFGTEIALDRAMPFVDVLRVPLFASAYGLLAAVLWTNRRYPGLTLALVGVILNGGVIVLNGGRMPIWEPSLSAAGLTTSALSPSFHILLSAGDYAAFLAHLGPLGDIVPIPVPLVQNVASVGDLFLASGLAFFLFATVVRGPEEDLETPLLGLAGAIRLQRPLGPLVAHGQVRPETGLAAGLAEAAGLERPLLLASPGAGLAAPALAPLGLEGEIATGATGAPALVPPGIVERATRHPYVRLALNGPFSALWSGQLISLFGDRVHQIALGFLVYQATDSAIAVGLVFLTATLPNLLLGPIAGTLVDRWDQKEVMIVSDLLRASSVLLIPVVAAQNVFLAYPLVFLITSISIFFRPARTSVIPRIVTDDDLLAANSATWLGETMADIVGYPLATVFVAFLGPALPLAFWFDAATYVASAMLIASVVIPPVPRAEAVAVGVRGVFDDLLAGWQFLRHETVLLANTFQGVAGQFASGMLFAITLIYATQVLAGGSTEGGKIAYGLLEMAIGVGNLLGGIAIGFLGSRVGLGKLVIVGYVVWGITTMALGLVETLPLAFGLMLGGGIANMIYIIPSQTLFQERTPPDMIGRVVGFRFALVFGALTLAMGVGGVAVSLVGLVPVLVVGGFITSLAGAAGWLIPEVRSA